MRTPLDNTTGSIRYFRLGLNHVYDFSGTYSCQYIAIAPDGRRDTLTKYNELTIRTDCGNISGRAYIDNNSNCIYDSGDDLLPNTQVKVYNSSGFFTSVTTNSSGMYYVTVPNSQTYDIEAAPPYSGLTLTCPSSGKYTISSFPSNNNDFGFTCQLGYDVYGSMRRGFTQLFGPWPWWGGPGNDLRYGMVDVISAGVGNSHCENKDGKTKLKLDPKINYLSSTPSPNQFLGDTIIWDYFNLNSGSYFSPNVRVSVDSTANMGDTVCAELWVTPTNGDLDITNNYVRRCFVVVAPYDPNNKQVYPAGQGTQGYIPSNTMMTYLVNFQNIGNAEAHNVRIVDTLDANVDVNTLRIVGNSHNVSSEILNEKIVNFMFNNIMLPDSVSDEPGSHGYVIYQVKLKSGLANGTEIKNRANIYFDFNPAITTNMTLNTIDNTISIEDKKSNMSKIRIVPVPANDFIRIINEGELSIEKISIYNILGELIISEQTHSPETKIDVSNLPNGIYNVRIQSTKGIDANKIIISR